MNTTQLPAATLVATQRGRVLARRGPVRFLAVAGALVALAAAAAPAEATDHNARVAEYLLGQHRDTVTHNARVAEYLLGQHRDAVSHNARVAEYLLGQRPNGGH